MAGSFTVHPVRTRSEMRRFISFPYALYRDQACWVPPLRRAQAALLDPKKNAFFRHGQIQPFIAVDSSGKVLGRIAAVVNGMHLQTYQDETGFFGFFECIDAYEVAEALLETACAWLRQQGLSRVRGPASPSLNETSGLLISSFDREPSVMMPYNPPYYAPFLSRYGFERAMTMWAYYGDWKHLRTERLRRGAEIVRQRHPGLVLRKPDMRRFDEEAGLMLGIYNKAFARTWGHVPITPAEFGQMAKSIRPIVDPNLVFFLEDRGKPVGFSLSLPNLNRVLRHVRDGRLFPLGLPRLLLHSRFNEIFEFRTILMGVLPEYQRQGLDSLMVLATIEEGQRNGYRASEMSWVMDDNHVLKNALRAIGGVIDKEYALYERALT